MKIFILPISNKLQPKSQPFTYPKENKDYGVEQDFLNYLQNHSNLLCDNADQADWHYLPVYWTRWHLNHNYGRSGIGELQGLVNKTIIDSSKTFTICQYDNGPVVDLKSSTIFLASRKSENGFDIPLLRSHIKSKYNYTVKKYKASFVGRLQTHIVRKQMGKILESFPDVLIMDGDFGQEKFIQIMKESLIALCPRGYGGSSFRFFEAMQLGIVPFLLGDIDTRPFKQFINWSECSLYTNTVNEIPSIINDYDENSLIEMGRKAQEIYTEKLDYGKWPEFVVKEMNYAA